MVGPADPASKHTDADTILKYTHTQTNTLRPRELAQSHVDTYYIHAMYMYIQTRYKHYWYISTLCIYTRITYNHKNLHLCVVKGTLNLTKGFV